MNTESISLSETMQPNFPCLKGASSPKDTLLH